MPRRSRRKHQRKHHKSNSSKGSKKVYSNSSKQDFNDQNINTRLNCYDTDECDNFYRKKHHQITSDSDSDPDIYYEFYRESDLNRAKSDTALSKLYKYSSEINTTDDESTSWNNSDKEKSDFGNFLNQRLEAIMIERISSTTKTEEQNALKLNDKMKTMSLSHILPNRSRSPIMNSSSSDFIGELHLKNEVHLKEAKNINCKNSCNQFIQNQIPSKKMEKSCENLNQQLLMLLNDEVPELGITNIAPRRLNSTSNILEKSGGIQSQFKIDTIQEIAVQVFENKQYSENSFEDFDCFEESKEDKIYLEKTRNEKHLLNCSVLNEEPRNRSTPILKTNRFGERKISSPNSIISKNLESVVSTAINDVTIEEYHSCCNKEFYNKDETLDEDESLYSCREAQSRSDEMMKIHQKNDFSVQCDLKEAKQQEIKCDSSSDSLPNKRGNVVDERDDLNVSSTRDENKNRFETFKKLFTKMSFQKFLHFLSVLPMDKILEFFCLTFSIPFVETTAVSVSVTKVMNVLTTVVSFSNLTVQLRNLSSRVLNYVRTNFASFFIVKAEEIKTAQCACCCDVQKVTDLEKRIKNLENELTKFQIMDKEIDKLKEIAKTLENSAAFGFSKPNPPPSVTAPPPPPPPPPPPLKIPSPLIVRKRGSILPQDSTSRPSITVEDLQKVTLRKVTANKQTTNEDKNKGPVVSLEMLRSVKLRSSGRKRTPNCSPCSPTRNETSRDRIRKLKSPPFRSSTRSTDRKSRFSSIPLSKILNMDDSLQLLDKFNETQKT